MAMWVLAVVAVVVFLVIAARKVWLSKPSRCGEVIVPPQQFIRASRRAVAKAVRDALTDPSAPVHYDPDTVSHVLQLLDHYYSLKYAKEEEEVLADYEELDPLQSGGRRATAQDAEGIEQRFLGSVTKMLERANYRPLAPREEEFALQDDYLITVPLTVGWGRLGHTMLERYLHSTAATGAAPPHSHARNLMVYHRGVSVDRTFGLLVFEKIDMAMRIVLAFASLPVKALFGALSHLPLMSGLSLQSNKLEDTSSLVMCPPPQEAGSVRKGLFGPKIGQDLDSAADRTAVKRIRLASLDFKSLLQPVLVQEPAFEELFLLFQPLPESDTMTTLSLQGAADASRKANPHYVFLRAFRNIPMADLEVTFPEVRVGLKPVDMLTFIFTAVFGLGALASELFSSSPGIGTATWIAVGLALYTVRLFVSRATSMAHYQNTVLNALYSRSIGNNRTALEHLVASVREQEYKEAVLAWGVLAACGKPMRPRDISARCNELLAPICESPAKVPTAIETDDAMRKVLDLNLAHIRADSATMLEAVTPEQAVAVLNESIRKLL
jgi:hypothetical protein